MSEENRPKWEKVVTWCIRVNDHTTYEVSRGAGPSDLDCVECWSNKFGDSERSEFTLIQKPEGWWGCIEHAPLTDHLNQHGLPEGFHDD